MQTIVALSTGPIHGAIAIVRISGPDALLVADSLFHSALGKSLSQLPSRTALLGELRDGEVPVDQVVATCYLAPHSYTGEDMVEFACHGSPYVVERMLQLAIARGARLAARGEFTRRAFLNGKLDLVQAEAVADLINARSEPQARVAFSQLKGELSKEVDMLRAQLLELAALLELELDFSEEDVEFADRSQLTLLAQSAQGHVEKLLASYVTGNAVREGVKVVIAGAPNAGKSSLLNALAQEEVALVSDVPGTTRDAIETVLRIEGLQFRLIDTAGLRDAVDPVERMGVQRAEQRIAQAAALIIVIDSTQPCESLIDSIDEALTYALPEARVAIVLSKVDLQRFELLARLQECVQTHAPRATVMPWAAPTRSGECEILDWLRGVAESLLQACGDAVVTSTRQVAALREAQKSIQELGQLLDTHATTDILAFQLRAAIDALASITGAVSNEAILDYIFSRFCIGK